MVNHIEIALAKRAQPKVSQTPTESQAPANGGLFGAVQIDASNQQIVEVVKSTEAWSVYELADGTIVRVKPVIAEFLILPGQYTAEGEPVYVMKGGLVPSTRVPKNLWRKP